MSTLDSRLVLMLKQLNKYLDHFIFYTDGVNVMKTEKLKALIYMTAVLGLSGCAAFEPEPYNIISPISHITITVDPMLGMMPNQYGSHEQGQAVVNGDTCHITLREYPVCLAHEVRHCFEGAWHPAETDKFPGNDDDCWQTGQQQNIR